jgi:hypothetical protein
VSLIDAAFALDDLASGRVPDRSQLIAGAFALDALYGQRQIDRDLEEARIALRLLAAAGPLESNQVGPARAALLAALVRRAAEEN